MVVSGAAALVLVGGMASADVDVQLRGGRVDVRATAAPLSQVLDRLARATGMKVVYQGATPSVLVSLGLEGRTPAEAVFGVLEGLGLNYAFVVDAAGTKVETLILAGAAGPKTASPSGPPPAAAAAPRYVPRSRTPPPAAGPDPSEDEGEGEEVGEEPEAEESGEVEDADEEGEQKPEAAAPPPGPRGNVLQPPAQPVFPSSPFAPRAPMFVPQPEPQPTPSPKPPDP
jgi:hypothetical protein